MDRLIKLGFIFALAFGINHLIYLEILEQSLKKEFEDCNQGVVFKAEINCYYDLCEVIRQDPEWITHVQKDFNGRVNFYKNQELLGSIILGSGLPGFFVITLTNQCKIIEKDFSLWKTIKSMTH